MPRSRTWRWLLGLAALIGFVACLWKAVFVTDPFTVRPILWLAVGLLCAAICARTLPLRRQ
ncbi:hypothetical protein [Marinivivus vitaminiproducens]|uniref:hypothetical protein n=1 Tax=Marinivivus vitaminiproducens TaxID=3035935 RepID=UPI0027995F5E|nr:hypothetical protein P4R82_24800 [Geminicoccaceae bacterium SCSIO 64248]